MTKVRIALIQRLLALPAVTSITTAARIYPGELATVPNPIYPCVNVVVQGSGVAAELIAIKDARAVIYVWSSSGYDQCHTIMDAIKAGMHRQKLTYDTMNIVPRMITDALETYDSTAQAHGVITNWRIQGVGK